MAVDWKQEYEFKLVSSLEKVFPDETPLYRPECLKLSALWGETVSFQAAFLNHNPLRELLELRIRFLSAERSPEEPILGKHIRVRTVELVPVQRAAKEVTDDNYLRTTPGLYPDRLQDLKDGKVIAPSGQWKSLWFDVEVTEEVPAGDYEIEISLTRENHTVASALMRVAVIGRKLPELPIIHTEWFHADCLADYYHVEVFSEKHWEILEHFFKEYAYRNCNMILTPLFTPPLDTAEGGERTTVQLIDVEVKDGVYSFGFAKLERWVTLCQKCGIRYFEMSHLFSQWGAKYPPKIIAETESGKQRIFGWETPAVGEYTRFLHAFLPQLTAKLKEWHIEEVTYFHLSDEPERKDLAGYRAAKESVGGLLEGFPQMDALSDYELYREGLVETPIPASDAIEEFIARGTENLWTYYCNAQSRDVSNRFLSMPSARNRIYGIQLYKYGIRGILHWGYNFYNSIYSLEHLNPYEVTDARNGFEAGDSFLVYPGPDGCPEESLRMMVLCEALNDLRALTLLESLTDKQHVMDLIEGELAEPVTFKCYPKSDMYLLTLRERVNRELAKLMNV